MNMLALALAALGGSGSSGGTSSIVADWDDIAVAYPTTTGYTNTIELTFSGGARLLYAEFASESAQIAVKLDTGAYTVIASGETFAVTTGQDVTFRFRGFGDESFVVSVYDYTGGGLIDTFNCQGTGFP
jgi:hypothetical protein